jgi:hypothetical protein
MEHAGTGATPLVLSGMPRYAVARRSHAAAETDHQADLGHSTDAQEVAASRRSSRSFFRPRAVLLLGSCKPLRGCMPTHNRARVVRLDSSVPPAVQPSRLRSVALSSATNA